MKLARLFGRRKGLSEFVQEFADTGLSEMLVEIGCPPVVRMEPFATGQNALVRRLILSGGRSLVLRAYFADPEKQSGLCHCYITQRLAGLGVRVATVRLRRTLPFPRGKADVEILLEDLIEGAVLSEAMRDDQSVRQKIATLLLRIHHEQCEQPGRPWLHQVWPDPLQEAVDKAPSRLARVRAILSDATPTRIESCLRWFRERVAHRPVPPWYELIHRDWNRENLLLTPDGELALVDLVSMAYGCFESDLVAARMMFFDAVWWAAFCEDYFAGAPDRRERFEQNAAVFFADFFLTKASRQASSARKALEKGRPEEAEMHRAKSRCFWQMLCACTDGQSPWKFDTVEYLSKNPYEQSARTKLE